MARVKINFPTQIPIFKMEIPVRITDLNYGNHLGNDSLLAIVHEARACFLREAGFTELNAGGSGLIMADAAIAYKSEAFFGDLLRIDVFSDQLTAMSFDLVYKVTTLRNKKEVTVADVKTGMVCFDYSNRKVCAMPGVLRETLQPKSV